MATEFDGRLDDHLLADSDDEHDDDTDADDEQDGSADYRDFEQMVADRAEWLSG